MQETVNNSPNNQELSETSPHDDLFEALESGRRKNVACALLDEYFSKASITGVRYFAERKRHWSERVFWVIAFIVSLYFSCVLILNLWNKWNESPVIVSFAEKATPVWKIPFPAVTICPETKFNTDKLNYTETFHILTNGEKDNLTDDVIAQMNAAAHICDSHLVSNLGLDQNVADKSIFETINDSSPSIDDSMVFCRWRRELDICPSFFKPILTEQGLCFTFNALNSRDIYTDAMAPEMLTVTDNPNAPHWNQENGYSDSEENGLNTYPYRVPSAGARVGLFAVLQLLQKDFDYICRGPVQGFKIVLHTPDEVPQVAKHYFRVPLNQEVLVSVQPQMITTSNGLRNQNPNRRGCYFSSERSLKYLKTYTQHNCELECLANFTRHECGCVKFSMPRDKDTPICGAAQVECYEEAADKMLEIFFNGDFERKRINNVCDCLPACTSITYDAEISQAKFDLENLANAYGTGEDYVGVQMSRLSIFFKEHQFTTSRRSELYGLTDFLANCGGLLALFIGISVLGIVEIIYFFTLRFCCTLRMHKPSEQKLSSVASNPLGDNSTAPKNQ